MKCSVQQNFHSLPYPFVNLFKLDTLVFNFISNDSRWEWRRRVCGDLSERGIFCNQTIAQKILWTKVQKLKIIIIGDYSVQCTLMTQSFLPPDSGSLRPQYPYPYFFNSSPKKCLSYFFFNGGYSHPTTLNGQKGFYYNQSK